MATTRRVYRRVYERALRHREVEVLALDEVLPTAGRSVHDIGFRVRRLQPGRERAEELVGEVARMYPDPAVLDEQMDRWFLP